MNKEFGSDYHLIRHESVPNMIEFPSNSIFLGSGREALLLLLEEKTLNRKWRRIFVPEYYCEDVLKAIANIDIEKVFYAENPKMEFTKFSELKFEDGDVFLKVNYFGITDGINDIKVEVIEDLSHAFFYDGSIQSSADWCFASIRKYLPVPDGGILWSPKNHVLYVTDIKTTIEHRSNISKRYQAMKLKKRYLDDEVKVNKDEYRKLFMESEKEIGKGQISAISEISTEIINGIDKKFLFDRKKNYEALYGKIVKTGLETVGSNKVLRENVIPFSFIILFKNNREREYLRLKLIQNNIYPSVLWPIKNEASEESRSFSKNMLSIHCDGRYNEDDMCFIGEKIIEGCTELNII